MKAGKVLKIKAPKSQGAVQRPYTKPKKRVSYKDVLKHGNMALPR